MKILFSKFAEDRYNICKMCEHHDSKRKKCSKCGCYLPAKINYYKSKCPVGKW